MSYSSQTPNLGLPQWILSDPPQMSDFNAAFVNVDNFAGTKAQPNGLASLDSSGKLVQLPTLADLGLTISQGEWTPSLFAYAGTTNPTVTYTAQNGKYFRIGNLVYVYFSIAGNITQLGNGNAGIKGLPEEIIPLNGIPITLGRCFFLVGTDPTVSFTANIDSSTGEIQIRNAGGRTRQNFVLSTEEAFNILGTAVYLIA